MVLAELGQSITTALKKMANNTVIDSKVVDDLLKEISMALLSADVNIKLVSEMRKKCKAALDLDNMPAGVNKRRMVQKIVFDEICELVDPHVKPFTPKRGEPNIIMFVGLQGSGKTTTCTKLAYYYKKKNWKVGLVCADTFRAGAFDQLRQNATKARIPYFGKDDDSDPVKVAAEGVDTFKKEKFEIIIIDTSGRHKQEEALFEEMRMISSAVQPNGTILVMDSSIGQAAFSQARAFHEAVTVGSVIITKMDGHAKGGGALSAVAATQSPIAFIGTGEHFDDFEQFAAKPFVSRLLGFGDVMGLVNTIKDAGIEQQTELVQRILDNKGKFSLKDMYDQYTNMMKMGPLNKIMEMLPGMNQGMIPKGGEKEAQLRMKASIVMMDSMTKEELDNPKLFQGDKGKSRIRRVAIGSGRSIGDVENLLVEYKRMAKMFESMGAMGNKMKMGSHGQVNPAQMQQMLKGMDPRVLQRMGGMGGITDMMKSIGSDKDAMKMLEQMGMGNQ